MRLFLLCLVSCLGGVAFTQEFKLAERLSLVWGMYEEIERSCSVAGEGVTEGVDYADLQSQADNCLHACVQRKIHVLGDDGFSRKEMDSIVSYVFQDEPFLKSLALAVNLSCEKKLAKLKLTDECEMSLRIHQCLQDNWKRSGFKYWTSKWKH